MRNTLPQEIKITKANTSKIEQVDFKNLAFGKVFTDHMFVCDYVNGKWQTPEIIPYGPLTCLLYTSPSPRD